MSSHRALYELDREARAFVELLEQRAAAGVSVERLIDRHLEFRAIASAAFRVITDEELTPETWALDRVVDALEARLRTVLASVVPSEAIVVTGFSRTHRKLYEYLYRAEGRGVGAARLRVLTGDQVHTERRVRELRSAGLGISWGREAGQNVYRLLGDGFDEATALKYFLPRVVSGVPAWSAARRRAVLASFGLGDRET